MKQTQRRIIWYRDLDSIIPFFSYFYHHFHISFPHKLPLHPHDPLITSPSIQAAVSMYHRCSGISDKLYNYYVLPLHGKNFPFSHDLINHIHPNHYIILLSVEINRSLAPIHQCHPSAEIIRYPMIRSPRQFPGVHPAQNRYLLPLRNTPDQTSRSRQEKYRSSCEQRVRSADQPCT